MNANLFAGLSILCTVMVNVQQMDAQTESIDSMLIHREITKWEGLKTANFDLHPEWFIAELTSIGYLPDGSVYKSGEEQTHESGSLLEPEKYPPADFKLSSFKVIHAGPQVCIVTYQADGPLQLYATTVWQLMDDEWKTIFYQATRYKM